jgi:Domain of unknown function (DUF4411)
MYLIDANAFIEASRHYYSFNLAPRYWEWLYEQSVAGTIGSIQAVYDEIADGEDALSEWVRENTPLEFWLPEDDGSVAAISELAAWAVGPTRQFTQPAVDEFMASADLGLVAQARGLNATIITREVASPDSKKRVKLPDAAAAVGVACVQPFQAYEALGLRFA